jgi:hypothetical protein
MNYICLGYIEDKYFTGLSPRRDLDNALARWAREFRAHASPVSPSYVAT